MAAFQALVDDLMEFGLRLRPRVAIALATVSCMIFHVVAAQTTPVAGQSIAQFTTQSLMHFTAFFLQFAVPFCLMVGVLVSILRRRRARNIMTRSRDNPRTAIAAMSWRDFEQLVGEAFRLQGFSVLEMGGPGPDGGVDLVLHKDGKRYLCQCKHWKSWSVGVGVVRELKGVIAAQEADGGYVITGGYFSREAEEFARRCGVELIDGLTLERMILLVTATVGVTEDKSENGLREDPRCPQCGAAMQEKVAGQGAFKGQPFWSCSTYPRCRGKVHIERAA